MGGGGVPGAGALVELGRLGRVILKGPPAARRARLRAVAAVLDRLAGRTRRCGPTRRGRWPGSWGGWRSCGGAGLKALEDLADAHVCAYVGLWWWTHGPTATLVAGDDATGAILVPRPPG